MKKLFGIVACVFALCTGFSGAAYSATENVILGATDAVFEQYRNAQGIVPVFFGAMAGPAGMIKPRFEAVAADYPDVAFVEVDAWDPDGPAQSEGITTIPTIIFYHDGEKGETITNMTQMSENNIRSKMQQYYATYGGGSYESSGGGSGSSVITFKVSYANGGGSGSAPSSPTGCTYDGNCNAPTNTYTAPTGKVFESWSCKTSNNSSCGTFLPGASISTATSTNNDTITLTAQWVYSGEYLLSMKTPTSKKYVDDELAKKQPKFSGLGNSKLMLYGATNGAVTSRDIVTSLGTSTTADSVPTRGAINTGLNTKQNKVNGTAGWVMENTGTSGSLTERPVYSTTDNYKNALVEAEDLNQMVIDAVNSELTQVTDGWRINDSVALPTLRALLNLDASIVGTGYCYRKLDGDTGSNGTCNATTLATLGATRNKSGLWGAVFDYGDIVGKSVCSTIESTYATASTDAQESSLSTEFNAQSGVGTPADTNARYCWCKMESVGGKPAVSRWVFRHNAFSSASVCASGCAGYCGSGVIDSSGLRSGLFNSVQ